MALVDLEDNLYRFVVWLLFMEAKANKEWWCLRETKEYV